MGMERLKSVFVFREKIRYHVSVCVKLSNFREVAGYERELSNHGLVILNGLLVLGLIGLSHVVDELKKSV